jgi:hypothetical protein
VRIHIDKILQADVSASDSLYARKLRNATPKERQIFLEETFRHYSNQNLFERFQKLKEIIDWQREHFDEYERCDEQHIAGMLAAEKKTKKTNTTPWSPIFGAAVARKAFWKIGMSLKLMHKRPSDEYIRWAESLDVKDFKSLHINEVSRNLRAAQRNLREITKKADALREEHLRQLIEQAEEQLCEATYQKRLQKIKQAHARQQNFKRLRSIIKPSQKGGLSYILVPKNFHPDEYPYNPEEVNDWEMVHAQEELQQYIQKRNITHFGQAHGTPFTVEPLSRLNWAANSP